MSNDQRGDGPNPKPWTVMVYMVANTSTDLDGYAIEDLREMEKGVNDNVNVIVKIKRMWPDTPQEFEIAYNAKTKTGQTTQVYETHWEEDARGGKLAVTHPNQSMADQATLGGFLKWAVKAYPADHYMLVLWGHAYGLAFGRDQGDPLKLTELAGALNELKNERNGAAIDILGTNACAMSYAEAAYELRDSAQYLVASQIYIPFSGWPYQEVLSGITAKTEPKQLGRQIVDSYVTGLNSAPTSDRVQMSLVDLGRAGDLRSQVRTLADKIRFAFKSEGVFDPERRASIRDAFIGAAAGEVRPLIDLSDFCRSLQRDVCTLSGLTEAERKQVRAEKWHLDTDDGLRAAAADTLNLLHGDDTDHANSLVIYQKAHPSLKDLSGVGIYAPFVTDDQDLKRLGLEEDAGHRRNGNAAGTTKHTYTGLSIFRDSLSWPDLVYTDLREAIPTPLMSFIESVGVTSLIDRLELAQIVLGINSAFNKLDRALFDAQRFVDNALRRARPTEDRPILRLLERRSMSNRETRREPSIASLTGTPAETPNGERELAVKFETFGKHWFERLETAIGLVELATRRGLTHGTFGLAPVANGGLNADEPGKPGEGGGPPPRDDSDGFSAPRNDNSSAHSRNGSASASRRRLRSVDDSTAPVFNLFRDAGDTLLQLEQAALELEDCAYGDLRTDDLRQRVVDISQSFAVLLDAAASSRWTITRVISNPTYGLGPGGPFTVNQREELADAAGLSSKVLALLAPMPSESFKARASVYQA